MTSGTSARSSRTRNPRRLRYSAQYANTMLDFATSPRIIVDLRRSLTRRVRADLSGLAVFGELSIVTAHNPRGESLPAPENAARQSRLEAELLSRGESFVRVEACSPDRSHTETSIALFTPRESCVRLARRYEQIAIFWFDGSHFWIVGALYAFEPVILPAKGARPQDAPL